MSSDLRANRTKYFAIRACFYEIIQCASEICKGNAEKSGRRPKRMQRKKKSLQKLCVFSRNLRKKRLIFAGLSVIINIMASCVPTQRRKTGAPAASGVPL
ncbi:MAG: hypothetical protein ACOYJ5_09200 [Acutalibacteraceae bacterium]|jgi:hypothetical protein